MLDVTFHSKAFKDYIDWQAEDRKTLKKINALIEDIQRNGFMQGACGARHWQTGTAQTRKLPREAGIQPPY